MDQQIYRWTNTICYDVEAHRETSLWVHIDTLKKKGGLKKVV